MLYQETKAAATATPQKREAERFDDLGNARRFFRLHGADVGYVRSRRRWFVWSGRHWREDETGEAERRAKAVIDELYSTAAALKDDPVAQKALATHAVKSSSAQRLASMLELASTEDGIAITGRQFDASPWLFNVVNGVLDVRTGELRPHDRKYLITKIAPTRFDSAAKAPRWLAFLDEIFAGNVELIAYLQRAIGSALTGITTDNVFWLLFGTGANGKTTTCEVLRHVFGDYARATDFSTFLARRDDPIRNDIARLAGARFVTAVEVEEGRRLAEVLLKQVTGGDMIIARRLYQEHVEFQPQFKLFLACNHKPAVWGTDHAIWRRIPLVPFTVTIPSERKDKGLKGKLIDEAPGILTWALEGCRAWQNGGLQAPEAVQAATKAYREEQDVAGDFLTECCVVSSNGTAASVEAKALYDAYERWCGEMGTEAVSARTFNTKVGERGFAYIRSHGRRSWRGLELSGARSVSVGAKCLDGGPNEPPF